MICAAVTLSAVESAQENIDKVNARFYRDGVGAIEYENKDNYEAAAGWLVFVAVMGMAIEPLLIILRLLNISFVNQYFVIFAIAVSSFNVFSYNSFKEVIVHLIVCTYL